MHKTKSYKNSHPICGVYRLFVCIVLFLPIDATLAQELRYLYPPRSGPDYTPPETTSNEENLTLIRRTNDPFLRIYPPPEGQAPKGTLLICPGGGYWVLAIHYEGDDVAKYFAAQGYLSIVLAYRLPKEATEAKTHHPLPQLDAIEALIHSRKIMAEYDAPTDRLALMGFSAGGHLAASATTLTADSTYRPDASILVYPVITMVEDYAHAGSRQNLLGRDSSRYAAYSPDRLATEVHPPTLFIHAMDDAGVLPANSLRYAERLRELGVPVALYLPEQGGHGFGMRSDLGWLSVTLGWLERLGWVVE